MTTERTKHPDAFGPGLRFAAKSLNVRTVARATAPLDVFGVVLRHNLRQGNEDHRHRVGSIDAERTCRNEVLRGSDRLDEAVEAILAKLAGLGLAPPRRDTIMAIELVVQPPHGWDRPEFWREAMAWVDTRFEHVAHAVVHRDQRNAHAHIVVLAVQEGRFAGNDMTSGRNMFKAQRIGFLKHMRDTLGIRLDRPARTLEQLAVSAGRGPKTRAAAERRDKALLKAASLGMGVDGHGGCSDPPTDPHAHAPEPTPLLRAVETLAMRVVPKATGCLPAITERGPHRQITRPCPPPPKPYTDPATNATGSPWTWRFARAVATSDRAGRQPDMRCTAGLDDTGSSRNDAAAALLLPVENTAQQHPTKEST